MKRPTYLWLLILSLIDLSALYTFWFHDDKYQLASLTIFALPPLLLAFFAYFKQNYTPRFWASVFSLFWFTHGIISAWTTPQTRLLAILAILFSLAIIFTAGWPSIARLINKNKH